MAEIKIEKKKPIWPWILVGLLVLGGILFVVFASTDDDDFNDDDRRDRDRREQVRDTTYQTRDRTTTGYSNDRGTATTVDRGNEVETYINHIGDTSRMDMDHEYSNNALKYLIAAVEAKARENNVDLDKDVREMKNDVRKLTDNPQATYHADIIEEVGSKIANSLEKIQRQNYPNLSSEIQDVKEAVKEISASELTLEQKKAINSFYQEAGEVLRKMS